VAGLPGVLGEPIRFVLNWGRRYSLWVFNFGLACCAIEFIASSMSRHDFMRLGVIPFAHGPRQADLMVVSGTVTDKMAPAIKRLYDQMPEPKYVISFGSCSNCGGPYWDSYSVTRASTRSFRWTCTCRAARRAPRRCCTASCACKRRSPPSRRASGACTGRTRWPAPPIP